MWLVYDQRDYYMPGLVASQKLYTSITSIFEHMHGILNVEKN